MYLTSSRTWATLLLILLALLASTHLWTPLNGDTALFHFGAQSLLDGDTLYKDWWDLKGPGVYLIHALSLLIYPSDGTGLHLLGMLGMLTVATSLFVWPFKNSLHNPRLVFLSGLLVVAPYYCIATQWHLSQPAVFAGLLLYGGYRGLLSTKRSLAVFGGICFSLAISIKLSAILPAISMIVISSLLARRVEEKTRTSLFVLFGFIGGISLLFSWLWFSGAWHSFWWTHTTWRKAASQFMNGVGLYRLKASTQWFVQYHIGLCILAALGSLKFYRERKKLSNCWWLAAIWMVTGYLGIAFEQFAAWPFDMLLLSIPLGLLALAGIDAASHELSRFTQKKVVLSIIVPILGVTIALAPTMPFFVHRLLSPPTKLEETAKVYKVAKWLKTAPSGKIYVFGNPRYLLASKRKMATSIHGWAWELQPKSMWQRFYQELQADSARFLLIEEQYSHLIQKRFPPLWHWIQSNYRRIQQKNVDKLWLMQRVKR